MLADGSIRGVAFYLQGQARSLGWGESITRDTAADDREE